MTAIVTIAGHLGLDAEMKTTPNNASYCHFGVAVSDKKNGNEKTTWYRCALFGKYGETMVQYLKKGTPVMISGTLDITLWTNKDDQVSAIPNVNVNTVKLMGQAKQQQAAPAPQPANNGGFDDDIPF